MTDSLFRDIDIVDGTGAPRRRGDVLIRAGRIAETGPVGSIQHVLVNGEFALENGTATGVRAGRAPRMDATREETR
ncbi:hypothetical protein [Nocardia sp. NPDC058497]|uniref:hypothetical protein n=1 Tax=Nocardia sp. NPDC058497 TaxID=3346529 RepID=UPI00364AA912